MSPALDESREICCPECRFLLGADLPVVTISSMGQVSEERTTRATNIFKNWYLLLKILQRHEEAIRKRWIKHNNAWRRALLLQVWPDMAAMHRPDFAELRKINRTSNRKRTRRPSPRSSYTMPYLNLEDLEQPLNLLFFLASRGRNRPDTFAFSDLQSAHCGKPVIQTDQLDNVKMRMYRQYSPKDYGSIVLPGSAVDKNQNDNQKFSLMDPGAALLVLEIQDLILDFLVKCCRRIMHDIDLDQIDHFPVKSNPKETGLAQPMATVTELARTAPYREPQRLSQLKWLSTLVTAKRDAIEEHIWSLREDPGYFTQAIGEWAEHHPAMIPDADRKPHRAVGTNEFWSLVVETMVSQTYNNLTVWATLEGLLCHLLEVIKKHGGHLDRRHALPDEVEMAFKELDYHSEKLEQAPLMPLAMGFASSPLLRNGWGRPSNEINPVFTELVDKPKSSRIHALFRSLFDKCTKETHGMTAITQEIQQIMDEKRNKDNEAISSLVAELFSDLALMVELRRQLNLFEPWCSVWRAKPPKHGHDSSGSLLMMSVVARAMDDIRVDAMPADFRYPSEKRKTKESVEQMRFAEDRLDFLWQCIDTCFAYVSGGLPTLALFSMAGMFGPPVRNLHRTPIWVERERTTSSDEDDGEENAPSPFTTYGPETANAADSTTQRRSKQKTRPTLSEPSDDPKSDSASESEESEVIVRISVDKRAFKVFSTMFYMPSLNERPPGEVAWTEFIHAMTTIGFNIQQGYGSSCAFVPDRIKLDRSIQIHRPHPCPKMRFWVAKQLGRRLNRAYGWTGETFVLE